MREEREEKKKEGEVQDDGQIFVLDFYSLSLSLFKC